MKMVSLRDALIVAASADGGCGNCVAASIDVLLKITDVTFQEMRDAVNDGEWPDEGLDLSEFEHASMATKEEMLKRIDKAREEWDDAQ